jgi:hypothetical protein
MIFRKTRKKDGDGHSFLINQPCLRLLLDPLQSICLLFKSGNGIDFAAAPENANGMSLRDGVLPGHELIFR